MPDFCKILKFWPMILEAILEILEIWKLINFCHKKNPQKPTFLGFLPKNTQERLEIVKFLIENKFWQILNLRIEPEILVIFWLTEDCRQFSGGNSGEPHAKITCFLLKNMEKSLQKTLVTDLLRS